ncbi:hypothetical protein [Microbacterium sp. JZ31]|nr:hypothetical protein [Microbacterium sp. JZ31]
MTQVARDQLGSITRVQGQARAHARAAGTPTAALVVWHVPCAEISFR